MRSIAERAKFHDARRWFEAGGTVLVSEHGHESTLPVTDITTTHNRDSIAWADLAFYVREWRNRYPNQRFYIVQQAPREGGFDESDLGIRDLAIVDRYYARDDLCEAGLG